MIRIFIISILLSLAFSGINEELLFSMLESADWKFSEESDGYLIFEKQYLDKKIYMVKKETILKKENIFNTITDIDNYSKILTSNNVFNDYLGEKNDNLYGYQKFTNFIPFVKNRQIIFEMNIANDDIISWVLLDNDHPYFNGYMQNKVKTLSFGAGIWEFSYEGDQSYIIHKFFIDPRLNIPKFIINNAAQNNVIQVVEDILNYTKKNK